MHIEQLALLCERQRSMLEEATSKLAGYTLAAPTSEPVTLEQDIGTVAAARAAIQARKIQTINNLVFPPCAKCSSVAIDI